MAIPISAPSTEASSGPVKYATRKNGMTNRRPPIRALGTALMMSRSFPPDHLTTKVTASTGTKIPMRP